MNTQLFSLMQRQGHLIENEEPIQRLAQSLYQCGFSSTRLSASQLAAVSLRIRRAESFEQAAEKVSDFLCNQLKKLVREQEKTQKKHSWYHDAQGQKTLISLGTLLLDWIRDRGFLPPSLKDKDMDLLVLQKFWDDFMVFYVYEHSTGSEMPLDKERE